jgi:uncharacterized protein YndB with AHSA1/START domain
MTATAATTWSLDREIVLSRVLAAPRALVFRAWSEAEHLCRWFGPAGFECTLRDTDLATQSPAAPGRTWRFDMVAPDGTVYPNRMVFLEVHAPERLVYDHDGGEDGDPRCFRVTITFDEQADGKTVVTLRQLHPTAERRKAVIAFGAVELGLQTLDKLAHHLREA